MSLVGSDSGKTPVAEDDGGRIRVGVQLPSIDAAGTGRFEIRQVARAAEDLGFDGVWLGDHLVFNAPVVESIVAAAVAAAVTERISIGFGVLVAPLRQPVWLAKQLGSLQIVSDERLEVGLGVGGEFEGEWRAAGVPVAERGRRLDAILEVLPSLIAGETATLGAPWNVEVPALSPGSKPPPVWIGGRSDAALRRAARFGAGWIGTWVDGERIGSARQRLAELGAPQTPITVQVLVNVDTDRNQARREMERYLNGIYRMPFDRVERYTASGDVDDISEHLHSLVQAGASTVVLMPSSPDYLRALPQLAEIAERVRASGRPADVSPV